MYADKLDRNLGQIEKSKCILLIKNTLNKVYGNTLSDNNTDEEMAKAVFKKLKPFLRTYNK